MTQDLLSRIAAHVAIKPEEPAFIFVRRHDDQGTALSWAQLWQSARTLADAFPPADERAVRGALVCCRDAKQFVVALVAAWMGGYWAIPAAGGFTARVGERNRHIIRNAEPDLVLHDLPPGQREDLIGHLPPKAACIDLGAPLPDWGTGQAAPQEQGGILQFTSGSTSDPKAVRLGPAQIEANCRAITRAYDLHGGTVGVHWLPLHHDMGLVGGVIVPLWGGGCSVLLDPMVFIQRPAVWLEQITRWRGTVTSAPNFAFDRLCRLSTDTNLQGIDLTCLENVIIGGEPVRRETVDRLVGRLGPCGLASRTIAPSYGMAEVTLLVSSGRKAGGPVFVRREGGLEVACLGPPIPELAVEVRDPATGAAVRDGVIGEIHLTGPSAGQVLTRGQLWRDPPPATGIATGDHGYLDGGEIFITGRAAHRLIVRGRNIFAEDVEGLAQASQVPGRLEAVAAIGIEAEGSQQLCLLIELARHAEGIDIAALNAAILRGVGVKPSRIALLRGAALPRTTSGKIRHAEARATYIAGDYQTRIVDHVFQSGN